MQKQHFHEFDQFIRVMGGESNIKMQTIANFAKQAVIFSDYLNI